MLNGQWGTWEQAVATKKNEIWGESTGAREIMNLLNGTRQGFYPTDSFLQVQTAKMGLEGLACLFCLAIDTVVVDVGDYCAYAKDGTEGAPPGIG